MSPMLAQARYYRFVGRFVDAVTNEALLHALREGSRQRALETAVEAFWDHSLPANDAPIALPRAA